MSLQKIRSLPWWNIGLFLATVASTVYVGGWLFSVSLLAILGAHEFGHYFAARRHGVSTTLPCFIPAPTFIGTFGAFIKIRSPIPNRRALFDLAVAGPLPALS